MWDARAVTSVKDSCVLPVPFAHTSWVTVHGLVATASFDLLKTVC